MTSVKPPKSNFFMYNGIKFKEQKTCFYYIIELGRKRAITILKRASHPIIKKIKSNNFQFKENVIARLTLHKAMMKLK